MTVKIDILFKHAYQLLKTLLSPSTDVILEQVSENNYTTIYFCIKCLQIIPHEHRLKIQKKTCAHIKQLNAQYSFVALQDLWIFAHRKCK